MILPTEHQCFEMQSVKCLVESYKEAIIYYDKVLQIDHCAELNHNHNIMFIILQKQLKMKKTQQLQK
ncbi:unnamed protein product [Paramecium octaurelia]|uniref:Uncharacterized protein n=1 Tax=Paramecium octaurelia TaxID=43137 RepID=A0A8S1TFP9_PAROT|nr:unnamed protein product [Paramecium octaurelia]